MAELLRFPDEVESRSDERCRRRLAESETADNIIGLTDALGACLAGLLSSLRQLGKVSQDLDNLVARLPAGEARRQIEHQQVLIKEQLVIARKLLAGF